MFYCRGNQWIGSFKIETSFRKELRILDRLKLILLLLISNYHNIYILERLSLVASVAMGNKENLGKANVGNKLLIQNRNMAITFQIKVSGPHSITL